MEIRNTIRFLIEECYTELRNSEKKVADYLLKCGEGPGDMSLAEMARRTGVSQPTVLRFARALGFDGYKDFQYAWVAEQARKVQEDEKKKMLYGYQLSQKDTMEEIPSRVIATTISMLENTLMSISSSTLIQVVEKLKIARNIYIFCVENSAATAKDLMTKLLYLGLNCSYMEDSYLQKICASNLTEEDVAIGISYSGQSRDTVDVMRTARRAGASTIVITNFEHSLLGKYADLILCSSQEQLLYGDAIFSRATQLAVVDMIYMGLILSDYQKYTKKLDKSSRLIQDKAYR